MLIAVSAEMHIFLCYDPVMATKKQDDAAKAIANHYARNQQGLPPPAEPHPGYPSLGAAWMAGIRRRDALIDKLFPPRPTAAAAPVPETAPEDLPPDPEPSSGE